MTNFRLAATAIVATCAMSTGIVTVPNLVWLPTAQATQPGREGEKIELSRYRDFSRIFSTGSTTSVEFQDPLSDGAPLKMNQGITASVFVDGQRQLVRFDPRDHFVVASEGSEEIYTRRHMDEDLEVELIFSLNIDYQAKSIKQDVEIRDLSGNPEGRMAQIDISNRPVPAQRGLTYSVRKDSGAYVLAYKELENSNLVKVEPEPGFVFSRSGAESAVLEGEANPEIEIVEGAPALQKTRWQSNEGDGATLQASLSLDFDSIPGVLDSDADGIPDAMERALASRYGTDPNKPQIYLQLNWMSSQRGVAKCYDPAEGNTKVNSGIRWYLECSQLDSEHYAPRVEDLEELVRIFARGGYSLHIDAGQLFHNFTGTAENDLKGGPINEYRDEWFEGISPKSRELIRLYETNITGERRNIFRAGFLGGRQTSRSNSSGTGILGVQNSFYVAVPGAYIPQNLELNTIVHEFGHNLGMEHGGPVEVNGEINPNHERNYVVDHRSTMNYEYQLVSDWADYLDHDLISSPVPQEKIDKCLAKLSPDRCPEPGASYRFFNEWKNLHLANGNIGKELDEIDPVDPDQPTEPTDPVDPDNPDDHEVETHDHEDVSVDTLLDQTADSNRGLAKFETVKPYELVRFDDKNTIKVHIGNVGSAAEKFTLFYSYNGRTEQQAFELAPRGEDGAEVVADIPMPGLENYDKPDLEVSFDLRNSKSVSQFRDTETYSFLDRSAEEARAELKKLVANPDLDPNAKKAAQRILERADNVVADAKAKPPVVKTSEKPAPTPAPSLEPENNSLVGSIFAIVLAIIGLLGMAGAALFGSGQLPPFLKKF